MLRRRLLGRIAALVGCAGCAVSCIGVRLASGSTAWDMTNDVEARCETPDAVVTVRIADLGAAPAYGATIAARNDSPVAFRVTGDGTPDGTPDGTRIGTVRAAGSSEAEWLVAGETRSLPAAGTPEQRAVVLELWAGGDPERAAGVGVQLDLALTLTSATGETRLPLAFTMLADGGGAGWVPALGILLAPVFAVVWGVSELADALGGD